MHYASRAALFIHCPPRFLSAFRTLPPASQPQTPSSIIFLLVLFGSRRISRRVFAVYTSVPMFSRISTNYFKVRFLILQPSFLASFSLFSRTRSKTVIDYFSSGFFSISRVYRNFFRQIFRTSVHSR